MDRTTKLALENLAHNLQAAVALSRLYTAFIIVHIALQASELSCIHAHRGGLCILHLPSAQQGSHGGKTLQTMHICSLQTPRYAQAAPTGTQQLKPTNCYNAHAAVPCCDITDSATWQTRNVCQQSCWLLSPATLLISKQYSCHSRPSCPKLERSLLTLSESSVAVYEHALW
jgi:hypothetical protein